MPPHNKSNINYIILYYFTYETSSDIIRIVKIWRMIYVTRSYILKYPYVRCNDRRRHIVRISYALLASSTRNS